MRDHRNLTEEELALLSAEVDAPIADAAPRRGGAFEALHAAEGNIRARNVQRPTPYWDRYQEIGELDTEEAPWYPRLGVIQEEFIPSAGRMFDELMGLISPQFLMDPHGEGFTEQQREMGALAGDIFRGLGSLAIGDTSVVPDAYFRGSEIGTLETTEEQDLELRQQRLEDQYPHTAPLMAGYDDLDKARELEQREFQRRFPSLGAMAEGIGVLTPVHPERGWQGTHALSRVVEQEPFEFGLDIALSATGIGVAAAGVRGGIAGVRAARRAISPLEGITDALDDFDLMTGELSAVGRLRRATLDIEVQGARSWSLQDLSQFGRRQTIGRGTGTLVSPTEAVTASHVLTGQPGAAVPDIQGIVARTHTGQQIDISTISGVSPEADIAVLDLPEIQDAMPLDVSGGVRQADPLYGHLPEGGYRQGVAGAEVARDPYTGAALRETTYVGEGGLSGAGVVTEEGQLGGIYLGLAGGRGVLADAPTVSRFLEGDRPTYDVRGFDREWHRERWMARGLHYQLGAEGFHSAPGAWDVGSWSRDRRDDERVQHVSSRGNIRSLPPLSESDPASVLFSAVSEEQNLFFRVGTWGEDVSQLSVGQTPGVIAQQDVVSLGRMLAETEITNLQSLQILTGDPVRAPRGTPEILGQRFVSDPDVLFELEIPQVGELRDIYRDITVEGGFVEQPRDVSSGARELISGAAVQLGFLSKEARQQFIPGGARGYLPSDYIVPSRGQEVEVQPRVGPGNVTTYETAPVEPPQRAPTRRFTEMTNEQLRFEIFYGDTYGRTRAEQVLSDRGYGPWSLATTPAARRERARWQAEDAQTREMREAGEEEVGSDFDREGYYTPESNPDRVSEDDPQNYQREAWETKEQQGDDTGLIGEEWEDIYGDFNRAEDEPEADVVLEEGRETIVYTPYSEEYGDIDLGTGGTLEGDLPGTAKVSSIQRYQADESGLLPSTQALIGEMFGTFIEMSKRRISVPREFVIREADAADPDWRNRMAMEHFERAERQRRDTATQEREAYHQFREQQIFFISQDQPLEWQLDVEGLTRRIGETQNIVMRSQLRGQLHELMKPVYSQATDRTKDYFQRQRMSLVQRIAQERRIEEIRLGEEVAARRGRLPREGHIATPPQNLADTFVDSAELPELSLEARQAEAAALERPAFAEAEFRQKVLEEEAGLREPEGPDEIMQARVARQNIAPDILREYVREKVSGDIAAVVDPSRLREFEEKGLELTWEERKGRVFSEQRISELGIDIYGSERARAENLQAFAAGFDDLTEQELGLLWHQTGTRESGVIREAQRLFNLRHVRDAPVPEIRVLGGAGVSPIEYSAVSAAERRQAVLLDIERGRSQTPTAEELVETGETAQRMVAERAASERYRGAHEAQVAQVQQASAQVRRQREDPAFQEFREVEQAELQKKTQRARMATLREMAKERGITVEQLVSLQEAAKERGITTAELAKERGIEFHSDPFVEADPLDLVTPRAWFGGLGISSERTYGLELELLTDLSRPELSRLLDYEVMRGLEIESDPSIRTSRRDIAVVHEDRWGDTERIEAAEYEQYRAEFTGPSWEQTVSPDHFEDWYAHELVFPKMQGQEGVDLISEAFETLQGIETELNTSMGMHIHVGAQDLSNYDLVGLWGAFAAREDVVDLMHEPSRRAMGSTYAESLLKQADSTTLGGLLREAMSGDLPETGLRDRLGKRLDRARRESLLSGDRRETFLDRVGYGDRYQKLNLRGYQHQTIEYRQPAPTLDPEEAIQHIRFATDFVDEFAGKPLEWAYRQDPRLQDEFAGLDFTFERPRESGQQILPMGVEFHSAETLTPSQRRAMEHTTGAAVVMAGPGSGKSRTLIERLRYLSEEGIATSDDVLTLVFGREARADLQQRTAELGGDWRIQTIDAFARGVVRENFGELGYTRAPDISGRSLQGWLSEPGRLDEFGVSDSEGDVPGEWAKLYEEARRGITAGKEDYSALPEPAQRAIHAFRLEKFRSGQMDYTDAIAQAGYLLESNEAVRQRYQDRFKFLQVDEFQDVSPSQARLIQNLSQNPWVVGDLDQSIMSFRGGTGSVMREMIESGASLYNIEENFRSTPEIVTAAQGFIRSNLGRIDLTQRAVSPSGAPVSMVGVDPLVPEWEAMGRIADEIKEGQQTAILSRTHRESDLYEEELPALLMERGWEEEDIKKNLFFETLHASKGREWQNVILPINLLESDFGNRQRLFTLPSSYASTPAELAEEQRLFYVGMTRAEENLTIMGDPSHPYYRDVSRAIGEATGGDTPAYMDFDALRDVIAGDEPTSTSRQGGGFLGGLVGRVGAAFDRYVHGDPVRRSGTVEQRRRSGERRRRRGDVEFHSAEYRQGADIPGLERFLRAADRHSGIFYRFESDDPSSYVSQDLAQTRAFALGGEGSLLPDSFVVPGMGKYETLIRRPGDERWSLFNDQYERIVRGEKEGTWDLYTEEYDPNKDSYDSVFSGPVDVGYVGRRGLYGHVDRSSFVDVSPETLGFRASEMPMQLSDTDRHLSIHFGTRTPFQEHVGALSPGEDVFLSHGVLARLPVNLEKVGVYSQQKYSVNPNFDEFIETGNLNLDWLADAIEGLPEGVNPDRIWGDYLSAQQGSEIVGLQGAARAAREGLKRRYRSGIEFHSLDPNDMDYDYDYESDFDTFEVGKKGVDASDPRVVFAKEGFVGTKDDWDATLNRGFVLPAPVNYDLEGSYTARGYPEFSASPETQWRLTQGTQTPVSNPLGGSPPSSGSPTRGRGLTFAQRLTRGFDEMVDDRAWGGPLSQIQGVVQDAAVMNAVATFAWEGTRVALGDDFNVGSLIHAGAASMAAIGLKMVDARLGYRGALPEPRYGLRELGGVVSDVPEGASDHLQRIFRDAGAGTSRWGRGSLSRELERYDWDDLESMFGESGTAYLTEFAYQSRRFGQKSHQTQRSLREELLDVVTGSVPRARRYVYDPENVEVNVETRRRGRLDQMLEWGSERFSGSVLDMWHQRRVQSRESDEVSILDRVFGPLQGEDATPHGLYMTLPIARGIGRLWGRFHAAKPFDQQGLRVDLQNLDHVARRWGADDWADRIEARKDIARERENMLEARRMDPHLYQWQDSQHFFSQISQTLGLDSSDVEFGRSRVASPYSRFGRHFSRLPEGAEYPLAAGAGLAGGYYGYEMLFGGDDEELTLEGAENYSVSPRYPFLAWLQRSRPYRRLRARAENLLDDVYGQASFHGEMLKSMILGKRNNLPREVKETFLETGQVHTLTQSGMHVSMFSNILSRYPVLAAPAVLSAARDMISSPDETVVESSQSFLDRYRLKESPWAPRWNPSLPSQAQIRLAESRGLLPDDYELEIPKEPAWAWWSNEENYWNAEERRMQRPPSEAQVDLLRARGLVPADYEAPVPERREIELNRGKPGFRNVLPWAVYGMFGVVPETGYSYMQTEGGDNAETQEVPLIDKMLAQQEGAASVDSYEVNESLYDWFRERGEKKGWFDKREEISYSQILHDSVVKLTVDGAQGTGFFVDDDIVATNYHVIEDIRENIGIALEGETRNVISAPAYRISWRDESRVNEEAYVVDEDIFMSVPGRGNFPIESVLAVDPENDIALLRVPEIEGLEPFVLGETDLSEDKRLLSLGYPRGAGKSPQLDTAEVREGSLSFFTAEESKGVDLTARGGNIYHGESGSPWFDPQTGDVYGILWGGTKANQLNKSVDYATTAFLTQSSDIQDLLDWVDEREPLKKRWTYKTGSRGEKSYPYRVGFASEITYPGSQQGNGESESIKKQGYRIDGFEFDVHESPFPGFNPWLDPHPEGLLEDEGKSYFHGLPLHLIGDAALDFGAGLYQSAGDTSVGRLRELEAADDEPEELVSNEQSESLKELYIRLGIPLTGPVTRHHVNLLLENDPRGKKEGNEKRSRAEIRDSNRAKASGPLSGKAETYMDSLYRRFKGLPPSGYDREKTSAFVEAGNFEGISREQGSHVIHFLQQELEKDMPDSSDAPAGMSDSALRYARSMRSQWQGTAPYGYDETQAREWASGDMSGLTAEQGSHAIYFLQQQGEEDEEPTTPAGMSASALRYARSMRSQWQGSAPHGYDEAQAREWASGDMSGLTAEQGSHAIYFLQQQGEKDGETRADAPRSMSDSALRYARSMQSQVTGDAPYGYDESQAREWASGDMSTLTPEQGSHAIYYWQQRKAEMPEREDKSQTQMSDASFRYLQSLAPDVFGEPKYDVMPIEDVDIEAARERGYFTRAEGSSLIDYYKAVQKSEGPARASEGQEAYLRRNLPQLFAGVPQEEKPMVPLAQLGAQMQETGYLTSDVAREMFRHVAEMPPPMASPRQRARLQAEFPWAFRRVGQAERYLESGGSYGVVQSLEDIYDADTFTGRLFDAEQGLTFQEDTVRLGDFNAPEIKPDRMKPREFQEREAARAREARDVFRSLVEQFNVGRDVEAEGYVIPIQFRHDAANLGGLERGFYGRVLGDVDFEGIDYEQFMIQQGMGSVYGANVEWGAEEIDPLSLWRRTPTYSQRVGKAATDTLWNVPGMLAMGLFEGHDPATAVEGTFRGTAQRLKETAITEAKRTGIQATTDFFKERFTDEFTPNNLSFAQRYLGDFGGVGEGIGNFMQSGWGAALAPIALAAGTAFVGERSLDANYADVIPSEGQREKSWNEYLLGRRENESLSPQGSEAVGLRLIKRALREVLSETGLGSMQDLSVGISRRLREDDARGITRSGGM